MANTGTPVIQHYIDVLDASGAAVQEIPVPGPVTVGRASPGSSPNVVIPPQCRSASRLHAVIEPRGEQVVLTDQSRFGCLINGKLVHRRSIQLHHGDDLVFGLAQDGWHVRYRTVGSPEDATTPEDPLELLAVSETPRQVRIGRLVVQEHLGDRAFRLLRFLADHKGDWYPVAHLEALLWPNPDTSPYQAHQALSRSKRAINDLLRPYLKGQDAVESWPHRGYRMRPTLGGSS